MKKITLTLGIILFIVSTAMSAFPVKKKSAETPKTEVTESIQDQNVPEGNIGVALESEYSAAASSDSESKWIAVGLWFFLGGLAAHRWYAKKPVGWNILFILTLGGLVVWWLVDGINILQDKFFD